MANLKITEEQIKLAEKLLSDRGKIEIVFKVEQGKVVMLAANRKLLL